MQKIPSEIAIGADPELFLFDNEAERIVPCVGILDGTKDEPYHPPDAPKGYGVQEDNVMVEYNIPACNSSGKFYKAIRLGRLYVQQELENRHGSKYSLYTGGHSHKFRGVDLTSRQAQTIGCEADFNAYEGGAVRANPPAPGLTRSCGGHVHLGGDFKCPDFVAALFAELFIGVRGREHIRPNDPRVEWYGQPGIYRSKTYGIEYRTPNNGWTLDSDRLNYVGEYALRCARFLTTTDSVTLQACFRAVPWLEVREYMLDPNKRTERAKKLWHNVISKAQKAGVPV